jgi:acetylornithine/succinyldiaminopimelate/putrescine aminotransferase
MGEVEEKHLDQNARAVGDSFKVLLTALKSEFPEVISEVRGLGLMLGVEFTEGFAQQFVSDRPLSIQMVVALEREGMLTIPAGARVVRFLPPLNVTEEQAAEAVAILKRTIEGLIS